MTHAQDVIRESEKVPTLNARMGTGGNQVPILLSAGFKGEQSASARGLGYKEEQCPTLTTATPPDVMTMENIPKEIMSTTGGADVLECKQGRPHGEVFQKHSRSVDGNGLERRTCTCNGKQTVGSLCAHDGRGFNGQDVSNDKLIVETMNESI